MSAHHSPHLCLGFECVPVGSLVLCADCPQGTRPCWIYDTSCYRTSDRQTSWCANRWSEALYRTLSDQWSCTWTIQEGLNTTTALNCFPYIPVAAVFEPVAAFVKLKLKSLVLCLLCCRFLISACLLATVKALHKFCLVELRFLHLCSMWQRWFGCWRIWW